MKTCYLQVFPKTTDVAILRLLAPDGTLIDERSIDRTAIDAFTTQIETAYTKHAPILSPLGQSLYEWMDGPTERWLDRIIDDPKGLALHIDVEERLRHLPWELMAPASQPFLCANALRPFTPVRRVTDRHQSIQPANRPLRVLLMATSPEETHPVLDFEDEERQILEATRRRGLELMVEESGSLQGLNDMIQFFEPGYFDVFHLSGHADVTDNIPHFIMEDDVGLRQDATAEEIAEAFSGAWPRLIFLSGCKTGQAPDQGGLPSMSEALVQAGAPAVLGWALPVGDRSASLLAAHLYASLATGVAVDEAVAKARRHLFEEKNPNWHLLRLYANATPLEEIVTRPSTRGRQRIQYRPASEAFLDDLGRTRVASRESFVGRRRQIQRCLKALGLPGSTGETYEGLLLYGMGGLGKSTLAARLCERMSPTHQRAVWYGKLDETEILNLTRQITFPDIETETEANDILNRPNTTLRSRLEYLFRGPLATTSCLFVFDNFEEGNLNETASGGHVGTPEALDILRAFMDAIRITNAESRVIMTSRYQFPIPSDGKVCEESMESMRGAELEKKLQRLPSLRDDATVAQELRDRAIATAAGNPRLLEWLDRILADPETEHEAILSAMEREAEAFRENVLAKTLLDRQKKAFRQMLALTQIFDIPVPLEAVEEVAGADRVDAHLARAVALGLIESGMDPTTGNPRYLVSNILAPLLADEITEDERKAAYHQGATTLHRIWVVEERDAN